MNEYTKEKWKVREIKYGLSSDWQVEGNGTILAKNLFKEEAEHICHLHNHYPALRDSHKKMVKALQNSRNIMVGLSQDHHCPDVITQITHRMLNKLTRQIISNDQALATAQKVEEENAEN